MQTILVACNTVEDEVKNALDRLGLDYSIVWVEGGLHDTPALLRARINEILREAEGKCDRLIFALGYCGGGMSDLKTGSYTTIIPLADDCLSILLGSIKARKAASTPVTYFLTAGWMRHETNLVDSYQRTVERYGQVKADRINKMMLANYERFGLVDTGCYDLEQAAERVGPLAKTVNLSVEQLPGDDSWLNRLLTGPHDNPDKFLIIPPNSDLGFEQWATLMGAESASRL